MRRNSNFYRKTFFILASLGIASTFSCGHHHTAKPNCSNPVAFSNAPTHGLDDLEEGVYEAVSYKNFLNYEKGHLTASGYQDGTKSPDFKMTCQSGTAYFADEMFEFVNYPVEFELLDHNSKNYLKAPTWSEVSFEFIPYEDDFGLFESYAQKHPLWKDSLHTLKDARVLFNEEYSDYEFRKLKDGLIELQAIREVHGNSHSIRVLYQKASKLSAPTSLDTLDNKKKSQRKKREAGR